MTGQALCFLVWVGLLGVRGGVRFRCVGGSESSVSSCMSSSRCVGLVVCCLESSGDFMLLLVFGLEVGVLSFQLVTLALTPRRNSCLLWRRVVWQEWLGSSQANMRDDLVPVL